MQGFPLPPVGVSSLGVMDKVRCAPVGEIQGHILRRPNELQRKGVLASSHAVARARARAHAWQLAIT